MSESKSAHTALSVQVVLGGLCLGAGHFRKSIVFSYSSARGGILEPRSFTFCSPCHGDRLLEMYFGMTFGDALPAMGISVLEEILCFGTVFDLILLRLDGLSMP